jgi:predicted nucleic acid-binding protein
MSKRVFVDANVLVSRTLRDWLCLLRAEIPSMFQLHTTEDVLAETIATLRAPHPSRDGGATTRLRAAILGSIDELVPDFPGDVPWHGGDPKDQHVHAAAVASHAEVLLTEDRGFHDLDDLPYEVLRCDDFFVLVDDVASWHVRSTVRRMNRYWSARSVPHPGLTAALSRAGCPEFARRVDSHLRACSGSTDEPPSDAESLTGPATSR